MATYAVVGATGHTGRPIALGLLAGGHNVRVVSRDPARAKDLIERGALLFQGRADDAALLSRAFEGADAAYLMIPPNAEAPDHLAAQDAHSAAMVAAIQQTGLPRAVTLSSIGAHLSHGAGVVQGLQRMEALLESIDGHAVLHLRPGYFLENTLFQVGPVLEMGVMVSPIRGDLALPMIATRDIAAYALERLAALDVNGKGVQYLLGAADVTYDEVARILGRAVGKPELRYVQATPEQTKEAMTAMGLGSSYVDRLNEFVVALNEGRVLSGHRRDARSTTPTTVEGFAPVFREAYVAQGGRVD
jgi:uncharacterized protein YbjT (DUF2867 family)